MDDCTGLLDRSFIRGAWPRAIRLVFWLPIWMVVAVATIILSPLALVLAEGGRRDGIVR